MGNKTSKDENKFKWKKNGGIFRMWEEEGSGDVRVLKQRLCEYQFGSKDPRECKILWISVDYGKRIPLIITRQTNIKFLERRVFPHIYNNYSADEDGYIITRARILNTKNKSPGTTYFTQNNLYTSIDEKRNYVIANTRDFDAIICCGICCCRVLC